MIERQGTRATKHDGSAVLLRKILKELKKINEKLEQMKESKRLECLYCQRVALWSERYELYVCDDCYAKGLGRDKAPKDNFYG